MKIYFGLIVILFIYCDLKAQEFSTFNPEEFNKDKNYGIFNYIQITGYKGQHMVDDPYTDFFKDGFYGVGVRFGTQSTGRKEWQRLHNYPQYGLGVSFFDLGGTAVDSLIGKPTALYFFYGWPIIRLGKFRVNADVELGLSTDFNAYDQETNEVQDFIGATTNLHSNFTLAFYYQISNRIDLSLGATFLHFSNGRSFTPQKGINLIGLNLSSSYHFNPIQNFTKRVRPDYQPPIRPEFIKEGKSPFRGHHEMTFLGSIGTVQAYPGEFKDNIGRVDSTGTEGPRYVTNTFSLEYAYQFARRLKVTTGLDVFYDGSLENNYDYILPHNTTFTDKTFIGWQLGGHYLIERVSVMLLYGRYIYKPFEQHGKSYLRAGGRIGVTEKLDVHVALKTRTEEPAKADWIEWGLAYKLVTTMKR